MENTNNTNILNNFTFETPTCKMKNIVLKTTMGGKKNTFSMIHQHYVYIITCKTNNMIHVGQSVDPF
jgi:hypothetical protein